MEVIKEWNTSSRGRNGEGRNRRVSVEERKFVYPDIMGSWLVIRGLELNGWQNVGCFASVQNDFS